MMRHLSTDIRGRVSLSKVSFNAIAGRFVLRNRAEGAAHYMRNSQITAPEDVSYVVSPYMPDCLREKNAKMLTSNACRSHESATGTSNIQDELDEAIILAGVRCCVGEYAEELHYRIIFTA